MVGARDNTLAPDAYSGAQITLTNPGGIGTVASVPRLMPGQGTIVATGAIGYPPGLTQADPAKLSDLGVAKVMTMTSTYDHRVIQGAESGAFLKRIDELLQGADGFYESVFEALDVAVARAESSQDDTAVTATEPAPGAGAARRHGDARRGAAPGGAGRDLGREGASHARAPGRAPGSAGGRATRRPGARPRIGEPLARADGAHPGLGAAGGGSGRDLRRGPAPPARDLHGHDRLRDRAHRGPQPPHLAAPGHRVGRVPQAPRPRRSAAGCSTRLSEVEALEGYLHKAFLGKKQFSIEGLDVLVPMLDETIELSSQSGAREVIVGMAHRGRLNVLAHTVGRPYKSILVEFEGEQTLSADTAAPEGGTGDVKYHYGASGTYTTRAGKGVTVSLSPNPSHLEYVNPVIEGRVRADQTSRTGREASRDPSLVVPILIHGDAAFPGQGIVAETLNLQALPGYSTGGTVHIIANNQLGFTTDPSDSRSTRYASDLAKGFDIPIIHVNADDVEACIAAVRLAVAFRNEFGRDALIDLIGYRRFGHNETDEPAYTQPDMYELIKKHPPVRKVYADRLAAEAGGLLRGGRPARRRRLRARGGRARGAQGAHGRPATHGRPRDRHDHEPRAKDHAPGRPPALAQRADREGAGGLHRAPQAPALPREAQGGGRRGGTGRLGARRGARLRVAARARRAHPPDGPGHRAGHLLPAAPRAPRRLERRRVVRAGATSPARSRRWSCTTLRCPSRRAWASSTATACRTPTSSCSGRRSSATS